MEIYPTSADQTFPQPARADNIDIGRQDYLSTAWRLTRMELYKLRHRTYSRVVLLILLGLVVLFVALIGLSSLSQANSPASSLVPPQCSAQPTSQCSTQHYSQAQLAQIKTADLQSKASVLGFPGSLKFAGAIFSYSLIVILGLLLLASIMGTEYSLGTIRLLFTRGPTRLQYILAKALAGLIYTAGVVVMLTLVYIIVGMLVYPMTGIPYSYTFGYFHAANFGTMFGNTLWLIAISIVNWYAFGVLALFFGTLGRSTAAALGGAFAWFFLEKVLPYLAAFLMNLVTTGPVHEILKAVPDYLFLGNLSALVQNRTQAIAGQSVAASADLHAAIVVSVYFVLLIGASCLITMRRDVTN